MKATSSGVKKRRRSWLNKLRSKEAKNRTRKKCERYIKEKTEEGYYNMKQNVKIILASGSPRRRELLTQAGLEFTVLITDADESIDITDPAEVVHILSQRKADAAADEFLKHREANQPCEADKSYEEGRPGQPCEADQPSEIGEGVLIVSADTVVALEGKVIGKPKDEKDALDILMSLSGKTHDVYTGVSCILISRDKRENVISFVERTGVTMYAFDEAEALDYISTKEPMDKAGAYGIQGIGARLVKKIDGDYNNVVGFPLAAFLRRCYNRFTRFE